MFRRSISALAYPLLPMRKSLDWLWTLQNRERLRLSAEMSDVRGLMQLLMKQRNGYRWSEVDRLKIKAKLRRLASLSPYLILFVSPGGFLALPFLAWWLDRRRIRRDAEERNLLEK